MRLAARLLLLRRSWFSPLVRLIADEADKSGKVIRAANVKSD
jgi:hypothetical protein